MLLLCDMLSRHACWFELHEDTLFIMEVEPSFIMELRYKIGYEILDFAGPLGMPRNRTLGTYVALQAKPCISMDPQALKWLAGDWVNCSFGLSCLNST